jgi:uncharacterized protein (TIGR03000 family)
MYSIVMMAAMTAAPETPDFFFNKGGGCHGCNGGGCYGSGWGYGGCHGSGWGYGGCRGGGGGCHGAVASSGCYGCNGGGHGFFGGHGFCGGLFGNKWGGGGCHGCYGGAPYYTGCGGYAVPVAPVGPAAGGRVVGYAGAPNLSTVLATGVPEAVATLPANRAQVVVRVPADAKLFADGQATQLTGPERVFLTPDLSTGRDFQYTLKVEYSANGETKSDTKQVAVRAGHRTVIEFAVPAAEKATSPVTVTLPEKAKLFVDGVEAASTGGKHTFQTPELPKGKPFVYEFRADVEKDGTTETMSQKVTFNAGEPVVVDFTEVTATRTALK